MSDIAEKVPTSVRFDPDIKAALQRRAEAEGRKFSQYVNWVLRQHVESTPEPRSHPLKSKKA